MAHTIIFTDGASKGNPGRGGWGAIVADDKHVEELGGYEPHTTNNRMELTAVLEALCHARSLKSKEVDIFLDSRYVLDGATKWGKGWRVRNWITKEKKPVLNRDLWEPLLDLLDAYEKKIRWTLIGGHVAIPGNERVDAIASDLAENKPVQLYAGSRAGYAFDLADISHDADMQSKKSASRTRSRAVAYSYVSEVDGIVEVHKTWRECEARVRGKKARFRKALSADDEREIVRAFSR